METDHNFNLVCRLCMNERVNMKNLYDSIITYDSQMKVAEFINKITTTKVSLFV